MKKKRQWHFDLMVFHDYFFTNALFVGVYRLSTESYVVSVTILITSETAKFPMTDINSFV